MLRALPITRAVVGVSATRGPRRAVMRTTVRWMLPAAGAVGFVLASVAGAHASGALVHPSVGGAAFETVEVAAQTIDSLVSTFALNPGFVKIDVEGMEHTVLAGMRSTMENFQPVILAECSEPLLRRNGSSAREIMREITRFGYLISDPLVPGAAPGTRAYGDILCIPRKRQQ